MKKKTSISDKTLKLIDQKQIKPIPKWEFVVKNWGLWLGVLASIGMLILGISELWFGLVDNIIVPYLWIVIAITCFAITFGLFLKTKRAYRFDRGLIMTLIIIVGIILGGIMFKMGVAGQIDKGLGIRSNHYRMMVPMRMQAWSKPAAGYLSGTIIKINDASSFVLRDFSGKVWTISGSNPTVRGRVSIQVKQEIKLVGSQTGDNSFEVDEIRPWNGMGQNMMKEND